MLVAIVSKKALTESIDPLGCTELVCKLFSFSKFHLRSLSETNTIFSLFVFINYKTIF